jgi:hypothetical protein
MALGDEAARDLAKLLHARRDPWSGKYAAAYREAMASAEPLGVDATLPLSPGRYATGYDMAADFASRLGDSLADLRYEDRFWNWLGMRCLLSGATAQRGRAPGQPGALGSPDRHLLGQRDRSGRSHPHRHLVRTATVLVASLDARTARFFLDRPPWTQGAHLERAGGRPRILACPQAMQAVAACFVAADGTHLPLGGRLEEVVGTLAQLAQNYELDEMAAPEIAALLPDCFEVERDRALGNLGGRGLDRAA